MKYGDRRYKNIGLEIACNTVNKIACNTVNKMYCHLTLCCCIADILGGGAVDKH